MFFEEQKGCNKGTRGTGELLYIDQHILNENKRKRKNLGVAWIDYTKACDMVPQSWVIDCLKMYKISDEVTKFIEETMKNLRVELTAGRKCLTEVKIRRCPITNSICNSNDTTQSHIYKMHKQVKIY